MAKFSALAWVCSLDSSDGISSTSLSTGTGLKKCSPMTCSGRLVTMASFMIGIDDVLDASSASRLVTTLSRAVNTSTLVGSCSATASTTSSRSAKSPMSVVNLRRSRAEFRSPSDSLPDRTPLASDAVIRPRPVSSASALISLTRTSSPARAHTSAMPEPINPEPTTPTRLISPTCHVLSRQAAGIHPNGRPAGVPRQPHWSSVDGQWDVGRHSGARRTSVPRRAPSRSRKHDGNVRLRGFTGCPAGPPTWLPAWPTPDRSGWRCRSSTPPPSAAPWCSGPSPCMPRR